KKSLGLFLNSLLYWRFFDAYDNAGSFLLTGSLIGSVSKTAPSLVSAADRIIITSPASLTSLSPSFRSSTGRQSETYFRNSRYVQVAASPLFSAILTSTEHILDLFFLIERDIEPKDGAPEWMG
ncbi:hypothetical protein, partial [Paenibacillus dendritiformis]|uniref:hypothetical protein n=1 Tax=Paenibacillus dendritiformis TaxID=130049 RepID=UPI001EE65753